MSLTGAGVVAIWHDLLPEAKLDFYEWHDREHMPERVDIPGFRRGRRYIAVVGGPEFFNLYEADSPHVLSGEDYLNRLNAPTPWTTRVVKSFRNVARSICRVEFTDGLGSGGIMLTMRFDVDPAWRDEAIGTLTRKLLPSVSSLAGIVGVHLALADEAISNIETNERKVRADATQVPKWIVLVEGISVVSVQEVVNMLGSSLTAYVAGATETAIYRHEFTRLKTPHSVG